MSKCLKSRQEVLKFTMAEGLAQDLQDQLKVSDSEVKCKYILWFKCPEGELEGPMLMIMLDTFFGSYN